jgi:hypothetical protein
MTISLPECAEQVERVMDLPYSPKTDAGKAELIRALYDVARSPQHAQRTISELVRGDRCPTPKEIIDTAWGLLSDAEKAGKRCPLCIDGWAEANRVINGIEYAYRKRCACRAASAVDHKMVAAGCDQ